MTKHMRHTKKTKKTKSFGKKRVSRRKSRKHTVKHTRKFSFGAFGSGSPDNLLNIQGPYM